MASGMIGRWPLPAEGFFSLWIGLRRERTTPNPLL